MNFRNKAVLAAVLLMFAANGTAFANDAAVSDINTEIVYENITVSDFITESTEITDNISDEEELPAAASEVLYSEELSLSQGLEYTRNLYYHPEQGNQREYILEYSPNEVTKLNFTGNKYLYSAKKISDMAAQSFPESNIIAAINGDFFNMSTGVPESAFIKDYELYTTDRDSFCLALTNDGRYFFDKPLIKISLVAQNGIEINIAHLNKEFSEYALYLYNHRYSDTTHIKNSYSQAVLLPFSDSKTLDEIISLINDPSVYELYGNDEQLESLINKAEQLSGYKHINGTFYNVTGVHPQIGKSENVVVYETNSNCSNSVIPENAYLLCGDNTSYGYIPASMKIGDTFILKVSGNELFENVTDAIGVGTIIVNNSEVIDDRTFDHYTSYQPRSAVGIREDGSLVFYAADGRQKNKSAGLKLYNLGEKMKELGCTYAANLDGGGSTVVYASRPGYDTSSVMSNPSGTVERKISNSFVFTNTLEKTNNAFSAHIYNDYMLTFSDWLINIENPVISDENGFTYTPAEEENININYYTDNGISGVVDKVLYPSGVTGKIDVFAEVNGNTNDSKPAFSIYTVNEPDVIELTSEVTEIAPFETAVLTVDSFYKNLKVSASPLCYVWSVKASFEEYATGDYGYVENGVFYHNKQGEEYTITASRGEISDSVIIKVDTYPFSDIENHWSVKEVYKLAKKGVVNGYPTDNGIPVYLPDNSYSRYEFCVMFDRMTDVGDNIEVLNIFNNEEIEDVKTNDDISDEQSFYENQTAEALEAEAVNSDEIAVLPGEQALLDFADASVVPEWAYSSLYKLYFTGWLDDIMQSDDNGSLNFNGGSFITREDVMKVVGKMCADVPEDFTIEEYSDLNDTQKNDENIKKCIYAGIFNGYEDMTLRLSNNLTRAEAATIFVRLQNYIENTSKQSNN